MGCASIQVVGIRVDDFLYKVTDDIAMLDSR